MKGQLRGLWSANRINIAVPAGKFANSAPGKNELSMKCNADAMYFHGLTSQFHQHPEFGKLTLTERVVFLVMIGSDAPGFNPSYHYIGTILSISDLKRVKKTVRSLIKKGWVRKYDGENGYSTYMYFVPGGAPENLKQRPLPRGGAIDPQGGCDRPPGGGAIDPPNLNLNSNNKKTPPPPATRGAEKPPVKEGGGLLRNSEPERSRDIPTFPDEVYSLLISLNLRTLTERYLKIFPDKMTVEYLSKLLAYINSQSDIKSKRKFAIAAIERDTWSPEDDMSKREPTKATILITAPCKKCRKHYEVTEQQARDYECPTCFYAPIERSPDEIERGGSVFDQFRRKRGIVRRVPKEESPSGSPRGGAPGETNTCGICHSPYTIDWQLDILCPPCRAESQKKNSLVNVEKTVDDHKSVY